MTDYKSAGVDIGHGEEAVKRLKKHVQTTFTKDVLQGVGAFAGAMRAADVKSKEQPAILATIDGVGTKTIVAHQMNQWEGVGHDIVNHCANDLVCQGGAPLLFLDYVASSSLDPSVVEQIVAGMSAACRDLGCALIGGETAEMPQVYHEGSHDVVGAMIGTAEMSQMILGEEIDVGDTLIALSSNGLHTNGYTLARKVLLEDAKMDLNAGADGLKGTLGEALLKPHSPYSALVRKLDTEIGLKGVAHITGGGIAGNLPRILPKGVGAKIRKSSIQVLPIFVLIQNAGDISDTAMLQAFNMGVGMILVCDPAQKDAVLAGAPGSYAIGEVTREEGVEIT